ncbi:hypothetical protein NDU88_007164 [Pleurodeles waltl]|uniref:Mitochondrial dicarboxylate carrier n=1 Tax=Pleurodeles waltl TaxID=8319 RepID=A0AAV7PLQ3_PLEWA|nr:hypothetical protein NDU88_007164 [Pleurodeles waltl]
MSDSTLAAATPCPRPRPWRYGQRGTPPPLRTLLRGHSERPEHLAGCHRRPQLSAAALCGVEVRLVEERSDFKGGRGGTRFHIWCPRVLQSVRGRSQSAAQPVQPARELPCSVRMRWHIPHGGREHLEAYLNVYDGEKAETADGDRAGKRLWVHLQTQQEVKLRMTGMALSVIRNDGFLALYNGLSASLFRQMTYSMTRFAIYETVRDRLSKNSNGPLPFYQKVLLGAFGGFTGGFVGTPADMVNVRMQNDMKLPAHLRRNYAHAIDGMYQVLRHEGLKKLFSGGSMASSRGALVTVGQLACYDQAKQLVLTTGILSDNIFTHFLASFIAGGCATFLCQPMDVLKTRLMNSKGEYRGVAHCAIETAKLGPMAFYKGFVPAAVRLVPHTVLTFIFLEQLRKYFGVRVPA